MVGENGYFVSERLKEMIRKYADKPELFFTEDGKVNNEYIDKIVAEHIDFAPDTRGGRTCIKETRATVCEIIADTLALGNPKDFLLKHMYFIIPPEAIDAAFAFLMVQKEKVEEDYLSFFEYTLPKDLYV